MQCDALAANGRVEDLSVIDLTTSATARLARLRRRLRGQGQILESNLARVVVVVTILAVIGGFTALLYNSKSQNEQAQLNTIVAAIANQFASSDYTGINESVVANGGHLQQAWTVGTPPAATGITSLFKSAITILPVNANLNYTITLPGVALANCVDLAAMSMGPNLVTMTVNGTAAPTLGQAFPAVQAQKACTSPTANSIVWTMQ